MFGGTPGGSTGLVYTPSFARARQANTVRKSSPIISGMIGVLLRPVLNPRRLRLARIYSALSHSASTRLGSDSITSRQASTVAALAGGKLALNINARA